MQHNRQNRHRLIRRLALWATLGLVAGLSACDGFPAAPTAVTSSSAQLEGWGVADASTMQWFFEYSTDASFPAASTTRTPTRTTSGLTAGGTYPISEAVGGLIANTRYYFRPCGRAQGKVVIDCAGKGSFLTTTRSNPADGVNAPLALGDPKVVLDNGTFYASGDYGPFGCNFYRSTNGQDWTRIAPSPCSDDPGGHSPTQEFPGGDAENQDVTGWGVEVAKIGTRWVIATSGQYRWGPNHHRGAIFTATASSPTGPWTWSPSAVVADANSTYIDPSLFDDPVTGKVWLTWTRHEDPPGPAWGLHNQLMARELDPATLRQVKAGSTDQVLLNTASAPLQSRELASSTQRIAEGQGVFYYDGRYHLYYANGDVRFDGGGDGGSAYTMNITSRTSFPGTFPKAANPIMSGGSGWRNPGHVSVFQDGGGTWWAATGAFQDSDPACPGSGCSRKLFLQRLAYNRSTKAFTLASGSQITTSSMGAPVATGTPWTSGVSPFTSARSFVIQQYDDVLHRTASEAWIDIRTADITTGNLDGDGLIRTFFATDEHKSRGPHLLRMYRALIGRAADPGGYDYWYGRLVSGTSLGTVADSFSNTPEFQALYSGLSNGQFVDTLYQNILGRPPDSAGRAYWLAELANGRSRGSVAFGIASSPEHIADTEVDVTIDDLYLTMLARLPTDTERAADQASFTNARPFVNFIGRLRRTAEYAARF